MPDIPLYFDLTKAKNLSKLVAKQVQVSRGGKTFMMTVWVDPSTGKSVQSDAKIDFKDFEAIKGDRDKAMKFLKDNGVVWDEHPNPAINWMRASMAAKAAGGVASTAAPKYSAGKSPAAGSNTSTATGGTKKAAPKIDYTKAASKGYDSADKKKKTAILKSGITKDEFMALAGAVVTWNEHSDPGINMMRASMAFSAWAETHTLADLEQTLTGATTQTPAQPTPPPAPPKPKEELEITAAHTPRQQALIKLINGITDKKDLEDFAKVGMIPQDDAAKSFILGRLGVQYDLHCRPQLTGGGGYSGGYYNQQDLRKDFAKRTSKLFKGMHQKTINSAVSDITKVETLYDLVAPRDGITWNESARGGVGKNTNIQELFYALNHQFGDYTGMLPEGQDPNDGSYYTQSRVWGYSLASKVSNIDRFTTDFSKMFDADKDGFIRAIRHISKGDPKLKAKADSMEADYLELQKIVGYNPFVLKSIQQLDYPRIQAIQQEENLRYLKASTLVGYLRDVKKMSDEDIKATISYNAKQSYSYSGTRGNLGQSFVLCDKNGPIEDMINGGNVHIDLTDPALGFIDPATQEPLWKSGREVISSWSDSGGQMVEYNWLQFVDGNDTYAKKRELYNAITPDAYNKFYEIQQRMFGYKLQDRNSMTLVGPGSSSLLSLSDMDRSDMWSLDAIRDGDDPERDAILANLSFIQNATAINMELSGAARQNPDSAANKNGTDYSGNFTYYNFTDGPKGEKGGGAKSYTVDEARKICQTQLDQTPIFTMDELQTLATYVSNNGDPAMKNFGRGQATDELLSRIHSLSPERQGWDGIKGTPIDDIYVKYLESTLQYCPQVFNQRVTDVPKMKTWLHKQLGFTPYQPHTAGAQAGSTTDLYNLRQALFSKVHCAVRSATTQEAADITHKVKMDFDEVDPVTGKRVAKPDRIYDDRSIALHGGVYIIEHSEAEENFKKEAARLGETPRQMYHGTSYGGACGIVGVDGRFRISGKDTFGGHQSGTMLGQGIYMAKLVGKTLPYIGNNTYTYNNYTLAQQPGPTQNFSADGCLLVCDAVLGKHYHSDISKDDAKAHNNGSYDSVAVGRGAAMGAYGRVKEYECCVRRNNQVMPKFIVDCGGRGR